jgi:hypothetical protein
VTGVGVGVTGVGVGVTGLGVGVAGHWKSPGTFLPHWLTSTEMATGSTRLMSSALASMVVQRHSAASSPETPDSSGQQV